MASRFVPSRGKLMGHGPPSSSAAAVLPGFFLPARQMFAPRQFSTTSKRPSKLGRTPITIPPGVELSMSDLKTIWSKTSYKPILKRTIAVEGPLGELLVSGKFSLFPSPHRPPTPSNACKEDCADRRGEYVAVGKLELDVPEFVRLQRDLENRTVLLSVEDANVAHQRTMWGMILLPLLQKDPGFMYMY